MPILYESLELEKPRRRGFQETKRYPIPWPSSMGCGSNVQTVKLHLPYNETKVHSVALVVAGELGTDGTPVTPVSCEVKFLVNGTPVASRGIWASTWPHADPFNIDVDIMTHVFEGDNELKIELTQSFHPLGCVSDVHNLSAFIELVYSGPEPPPPEFEKEWWEKLLGYAKWGLAGALVIGSVYVGVKLISERRK